MAEQAAGLQGGRTDDVEARRRKLEKALSAEPYKRITSGYGEGDYYDERMDWTLRGPDEKRGSYGSRRPDEDLYNEVCERLVQHGRLDASKIKVEVINGEVTLDGRVDSRWAKQTAEKLVEGVSGVRTIHNRLSIVDPRRVHPLDDSSQAGEWGQ